MHATAPAQTRILFVGDDRQVEHAAVLECLPHQTAIVDRLAIVGNRDDAKQVRLVRDGQ